MILVDAMALLENHYEHKEQGEDMRQIAVLPNPASPKRQTGKAAYPFMPSGLDFNSNFLLI